MNKETIPDSVPDKFRDEYIKTRNYIRQKYPKSSLYRSIKLIEEFKRRGYYFKDNKEVKSEINEWFENRWVNLKSYLDYKDGLIDKKDIKKCGDKSMLELGHSSCRPLYNKHEDNTKTADELIKKHGIKKLREFMNKKDKDPQGIIADWENLKIRQRK